MWVNPTFFRSFDTRKELVLHGSERVLGIRTWTLKNSNQRGCIKSDFLALGVCLDTNLTAVLATAGMLLFKIIYCAEWRSSLIEYSL